MNKSNDQRRPLYAKIALARKQLPGMEDDELYRDMLQNHFGTRRASDLNWHQLSRLVQILTEKGAVFVAKGSLKQEAKPHRQKPHARSDYYHIADDEFGPLKRKICAIWKKLGYDMTSLDTRCKREFAVESFAWLRDRAKLKRLLTDLELREKTFHAREWDAATEAERA